MSDELSEDLHMDNKIDFPKACGQATVSQDIKENKIVNNKDHANKCLEPSECTNMLKNELKQEEVDSDEERLEIYRKLKQDLDEDEKSRCSTEAAREERAYYPLPEITSCKQDITLSHSFISAYKNIQDRGATLLPRVQIMPLENQKILEDVSCDENLCEGNYIESNSCEAECINSGRQSNLESATIEFGAVSDKFADKAFSVLCRPGLDPVGEDSLASQSGREPQKMQEDVFVHNEELDEEISPTVDWSTITLPVRQTETLDDRLQLFSAGLNIGFQSEIAAEAQAASRSFWPTKNDSVETFGGLGEGEEVFGCDDDEDEES